MLLLEVKGLTSTGSQVSRTWQPCRHLYYQPKPREDAPSVQIFSVMTSCAQFKDCVRAEGLEQPSYEGIDTCILVVVRHSRSNLVTQKKIRALTVTLEPGSKEEQIPRRLLHLTGQS